MSILFDMQTLSEEFAAQLQLVSPKDNAILEDDAPIPVSGWLRMTGNPGEVRLVAKDSADGKELVDAVLVRSDDHAGALDADSSSRQMMFSFEVPGTTRGIGVSLCIGAGAKTIFSLSTATVFKVQRGGLHLFLDNDTNRSVDQYTGRLLLDEANQEAWRKYARVASSLDGPESTFRLLICPAKEEVFQDLYQHRRAQTTPIDQVVDICAGPQLLFPLEALRRDRESSYSTVDTHWSDLGAKVGAIEYLRSVGLSRAIGGLPDDFYQRKIYGDLGGKVDGGQTGIFMTLFRSYRFGTPGFDNGIGNHGRVWTYMNDDAEVQSTLVIFGDSFSVSLSAILASVFRRVVYCYTAAGLDPEILGIERPGYVLAQTNQRFVVNSPGTEASVFRQVAQKLGVLNDDERLSMCRRFGEDCPEPYYAKRMSGLLE